jgi:hypothetical protein
MAESNLMNHFFNGTFSKKTMLTRLVPMIIGVLLAPLFLANLLFPHPYDWRFVVISAFLSGSDNPTWNVIPSIGMTAAGFLMIGFLGYYQKKLGKICRGSAGVGTAFMLVAIIGLIGVGTIGQAGDLIPAFHQLLADNGLEKLHEYLAALGFVGVVFAAIFYGCPILKDNAKGAKQFNMGLFWVATIVLLVPVIGMAASSIIGSDLPWGYEAVQYVMDNPGTPVLLSFAFWEWLLFAGVAVYIFSLAILVPENVIPFEKRG